MAATSLKVKSGEPQTGEIPEESVRMVLTCGTQVTNGKVKMGQREELFFYGKNEYVLQGETSYEISADQDVEVVVDFVALPATVDAYIEQKVNEMIGPMQTKLQDHEDRITALENAPAP
jgi:hypothetical protein